MKNKMRFLNLLAVLIVLFTGVYQANAALLAKAPNLNLGGFPMWVQDQTGLALQGCLDGTLGPLGTDPPRCFLPNQVPPIEQAGFDPVAPKDENNWPAENMYYLSTTADMTLPTGQIANVEFAVEATVATNGAALVPGSQLMFHRLRMLFLPNTPAGTGGTYTVVHPWGTTVFTPALQEVPFGVGGPRGRATADVNLAEATDLPTPFAGILGNDPLFAMSTFPASVPIPPAINPPGFLGDCDSFLPITGGVAGVNTVQIFGPDGTLVGQTNLFSVCGQKTGMEVSPASSEFGIWKLNTPSTPITFTVTNLTGLDIPARDVLAGEGLIMLPDNPLFSIPAATDTCADGIPALGANTCTFGVVFTPTADGLATSNILISSAGNPNATVTVTGTGDGIAPTVTLDSPKFFSNSVTKTITGTVADNVGGAGVASVNVSVNGGAPVSVTPTGGTWSFDATVLTPDVDNDVSVTATDLALPVPGNTSAAVLGTITVDLIAPVVAINAVNPQTNITTQTITGTASDLNGISSISVSVNGAVQGTATVTGATWSFDVTGLINGDNTIIATATDPAGNSTPSAPATITVDTIPPALTLTAVTTPTKAAVQTIGGTVEVGATVTVNGQSATVIGTAWSFDFALTAPDGAKSITIIATDAATNTTTETSSITLDTAPPVATISGTPANRTNIIGATLTVAGPQVVSYRWKIDSGAFVGTYSTDIPVSTPITIAPPLVDGLYTVSVIGMDAAGNLQLEANPTTVSWTIDTVLPALTLNPVTALTNLNSQPLTGTMEAGATVAVNGQPATPTGATTWSFTLPLTAPDGTKPVSVTATDAATNVNTALASIILDTTAPALTLADVASPTRASTQTISGTVEAGATVKVAIGSGTPADATVNNITSTWEFNVTGLVEGANSILVTATDPVGNPANQQSSINIVLPNGDINGDAAVTTGDALKSLQFAAGLIQPTAVEALHSDVAPLVNGISAPNGKVDTGDVMLILRKSVGLVNWQTNN